MWYRLGLLTILIAVLTLPVGLLAAMFVGVQAAAVVFIVGWLLLTPLVPILGSLWAGDGDAESSAEPDDPLTELKRRYAAGEIGEAEYERRLENLLEAESAERASDVRSDESGRPASRGLERELE